LSILLRFMDFDCPVGIFKQLFLIFTLNVTPMVNVLPDAMTKETTSILPYKFSTR